MKREIQKSQSTQLLQSELQKQIMQRQNEVKIERVSDAAMLQMNKKADEAHWENEFQA